MLHTQVGRVSLRLSGFRFDSDLTLHQTNLTGIFSNLSSLFVPVKTEVLEIKKKDV